MLRIFDSLWLNSLVGLFILLILTIINLIMSRRKTMPVIFLDHVFFTVVCIVLFGFPCLFYGIGTFILIIIKKYRDRYISDGSALDYTSTIYSISRVINKMNSRKGGDIVVGNIVPTNHTMIKNNMRAVRVSDIILSGGTLLTGASGSGKTTTMLSMVKQAIEKNKPVTFFDYKGELEILDDLKEFCEKSGVPFYEFSTRDCTFSYDPLKNLNETGKVEAILNTRRWSADGADEHYKTSMQLAIQNLVRHYDNYREEVNDTSNYLPGLYKFCSNYTPQANERDGFNTVLKMLEILLSSRAKDLFTNDKEEFTFQRTDCYVVAFSFVSSNKALANSLSSFIFQDLMDRGTINHYDPKMLLCVDEFGTLENSSIIKDILEKGRSGGIQTVFSILDINQIAMTTSMHFVQAILGTINSFLIHAGATQQTAELLSGVQKYQLDFDIMSLQKPYKNNPPTAFFISKYPIFNKKGSQEAYKIIPYSYNKTIKEKKNVAYIPEKPVFTETKEEINEENNVLVDNVFIEENNDINPEFMTFEELERYF